MNHDLSQSIWFTADLHFGHKAMVTRSWGRPFKTVEEMDAHLIEEWNAVVAPRDIVFLLGDVSFRNSTETVDILEQLNGYLNLIEGNHDRGLARYALDMFDSVVPYRELKVNGQRICMSHYPFRSWHQMQYGSWQLHGHCHNNLEGRGKQLDVGVDFAAEYCGTYRPLDFEEVQFIMSKRPPWAETKDHHQPKEET